METTKDELKEDVYSTRAGKENPDGSFTAELCRNGVPYSQVSVYSLSDLLSKRSKE